MSRFHARYYESFDAGKAFAIRTRNAIARVDIGARITAIIDSLLPSIIGLDDAGVTAYLRAHGGYTKLINEAIGPEPARSINESGFIDTDEWYVWSYLRTQNQEIRLALQARYHDAHAEAAR